MKGELQSQFESEKIELRNQFESEKKALQSRFVAADVESRYPSVGIAGLGVSRMSVAGVASVRKIVTGKTSLIPRVLSLLPLASPESVLPSFVSVSDVISPNEAHTPICECNRG